MSVLKQEDKFQRTNIIACNIKLQRSLSSNGQKRLIKDRRVIKNFTSLRKLKLTQRTTITYLSTLIREVRRWEI